jgi:hypothetical protein
MERLLLQPFKHVTQKPHRIFVLSVLHAAAVVWAAPSQGGNIAASLAEIAGEAADRSSQSRPIDCGHFCPSRQHCDFHIGACVPIAEASRDAGSEEPAPIRAPPTGALAPKPVKRMSATRLPATTVDILRQPLPLKPSEAEHTPKLTTLHASPE